MLVERANSASLSLLSMYEISKILTASASLEASLRAVLNLMSSYMEMRRGVVAILAEDGSLDVVAAACLAPSAIESGVADLPEAVAARILSGQMPFVTENVADHPLLVDYIGPSGALDDERVSFIGVPIKTVGRPFGVLAIARMWTDGNEVSFGNDVRFLTMVANLIAQTVVLHQRAESGRDVAAPRLATPPRPKSFAPRAATTIDNIIGHSKAMQEVFAQIHLVAPTRSTVVLRGESGTGKERIARAVHLLSPRKDAPFIKVNCAALPDSLLESELFGHEKGAFTGATHDRKGRFELADGGTLFLDEIGDVSPSFQAKLLRVLQEREFERVGGTKTIKVDVRLVCATNRNLEEMVAKGDFRADLYYRINVVPVFIPALRERPDDIPLLALHFLNAFNDDNARTLRFTERALNVLAGCNYPGNVRELENCVNRVATMTKGDVIDEIDVPCQTNRCQCMSLMSQTALSPVPMAGGGSGATGPATGGPGAGGQAAGGPGSSGPAAASGPATGTSGRCPAGSGMPGVGMPGAGAPPPTIGFPAPSDADASGLADWHSLDDLGDLEALPQRERLIRVMEKSGWVQAKAARMLGLTPRQIGYALRKYNIEIKRL
ncbi:MAG: nif-specific transcriptional activator NifA [Rhodospirillales bacterium]|nr:nif-specific transcriptional activator NifA [Rhodospirillales bacterium]